MMLGLDLPVLWCNDEQYELQKMNVYIDISKSDVKVHTFYNIDHIRPYDDNHCTVVSGSFYYIVKMKHSEVKKRIDERLMIIKFN